VNGPPEDEQKIVRYLLGQLPEDERTVLEQQYFADPAHLERVEMVEADLIDSYLDGALSETETHQFEARYLSSPALRTKAELAKALRSPRGLAAAPFWRYAVAASIVVLVAGLGWSAYRVSQLDTVRRDLERHLAAERSRSAALEQRLSGPAPVIASFVLSPGSERAIAERQRFLVPSDVTTIRLRLALDGAAASAYHASLKTFEGHLVHDWGAVAPRGPSVDLEIAAAQIDSADYVISLGPASPSGPAHRSYVFQLKKQ